MSHVAIGKLLPNLKVTIDESSKKADQIKSEEVIINDDDDREVEVVRSWMTSLQNPKIYKNRSGAFTTGLDLMSEKNTEKLHKRAERFAIEREDSSISENILSLYESMGVDVENRNSAKMKNMRLDGLHMRGINELNTNDVFQYFQDYGPASVEWINDFSCNVVWLDEITCARALLGISKPFLTSSSKKESSSPDGSDSELSTPVSEKPLKEDGEEGELMETEESSLDIPVPPGIWRLGKPHPKAKSILLRFATKDDKKLPGAEKRSGFYQKYGNPNYGGLTGLISASRKRKMLAATNRRLVESINPISTEDSPVADDASTHKSRMPRMRMYADDEELKQIKLKILDKDAKPQRPSVHSRLGTKYTQDDLCHLGVDLSTRKRPGPQVDLRKKIKKLQIESNVNKHRSPLCVDD